MKSTLEKMKNTGMNMLNMSVKGKEKFSKTLILTEMARRRKMWTGTRIRTETRMDKGKELTNSMMKSTRNIFLKTKKAPIEQILSAGSTKL